MEGFGGSGFDSVGNAVRKKRSSTYRRPRSDSQPFPDSHNVNNASCHENNGCDTGSWKREFNLNQCALGFSSVDRTEGETSHDKTWKDDGESTEFGRLYGSGDSKGSTEKGRSESDFKRCSEGVLAPANWKSTSVVKESELQLRKRDSHVGSERNGENRSSQHSGVIPNILGTENKLRKVKLKVGGVTRTIHAKSTLDGVSGGGCASIKSTHSSDASRPWPKGTSDEDLSSLDKVSDFQGVRLKDFSRGGFGLQKEGSLRAITSDDGFLGKQTDKSEPVRKSKRVPKRRVFDGAFYDGDDNEEIRYLERFKPSEVTADYTREREDNGEEASKKQRRISRVLKSRAVDSDYDVDVDVEFASSQLHKDNKNSKPGRLSKDIDYVEEEEPASDGDPEANGNNQKKEFVDSLMGGKKELSLTKRQQSLQSGKDISAGSGLCLIEFPNGLPPAPPRKQKEKLSEVEQQLKKAEAAQRRRMQMEKAARESEAEAIRKILGQDSSRKKREDKMKKRRDELIQERAANALTPPSNTVRWVIGPTGTVVIFPQDIGLPNIFDPRPCSYPPPREKCAGPLCTNTYKYRDSKSKLPLCSLQCYRAIHEQMQPVSTC